MDTAFIKVGEHEVGPGKPALLIAEVAQAHDGSLGMAHSFIDAVADAGADAVKFQTHIAEAESTASEAFRKSSPYISESKAEFWRRTGFDEAQWAGLAEHARQRGLLFLSSPFSVEAAELLMRVGVPAWKIASGEVTNFPMLERMAGTGLPILLSAGMSNWEEQDEVVGYIQGLGAPLALFQCTTAYPCPPEKVGLNLMHDLRSRYGVPVGLSDHTGKVYSALAAVSQGANLLEVHVTFSREMYGTSVDASLTLDELAEVVQATRFIEAMLNNPVDKDAQAAGMAGLREVFFRSVVPRRDLKAGTTLKAEDLTTKKPGSGIPANRIGEVIGRTLARDVAADQLLNMEDLA
ncbi:MAG: N-acetylneuraminate synthase family protein [Chloroflexi bacterium]|nr:N-acetylneuraminate synthase family protein [Chloroflexota bacterium]